MASPVILITGNKTNKQKHKTTVAKPSWEHIIQLTQEGKLCDKHYK